MLRFHILLTVLLLFVTGSRGAKILAITLVSSPSHGIWNRVLLEALAAKGHEVTSYMPFVGKNKTGITYYEVGGYYSDEEVMELTDLNLKEQLENLWIYGDSINKMQSQTDLPKQLVKESQNQYDLVIFEFCFGEYATTLLPSFNAPIFAINAYSDGFWHWDQMGAENYPSAFAQPLMTFRPPMSFLERTLNFITLSYDRYLYRQYKKRQQEVAHETFGKNIAQIEDVQQTFEFLLVNSGPPGIDPGRSLPPNVKEVGCLPCRPADPSKLQNDVKDFLDSATDGFIYFSLGSNLKSSLLPKENIADILDVFSRLKIKVLWKFEKDDLPGKPQNVMINKWLSQQDVLGHKNARLFISHGGRLSTQEATYHGVPLFVMPFLFDQHKNAETVINAEVGVKMKYSDFTKERFDAAIKEVLNNPRYKSNAARRSEIAKDSLHTPLEEAIFWVEYVIRHKGAKHLRPAGQHLNWIQLHSIDVIAFLLAPVLLILLLIKKIVKKIFLKDKRKLKKN
ncbi:UDP-glucosyltransferase 2-like [Neocloeon triangulifer]|uniref:UDP-glucosyltransferase 2-like n=1 Tax=Neocloeon triangulifer TaxID=2078957 RepID=UPI00286F1A8A|nr:UDP-glucosyltransferase 2-like [Neocloeon triangulifer]